MAIHLTMNTHERRVREGREAIVNVIPYVRLRVGEDPPVFVQNGHFFTEAGDEWETLPPWLDAEVAKLSPAMKREVGLLSEDLTPKKAK